MNNVIEYQNKKLVLKVKSITFDNDIAFIKHEKIAERFAAKTYFCDPFKSHQKGTIENGNRLLREYFPRMVDISSIMQSDIDVCIQLINDRPMKCLGYKTPSEVYFKLAVETIRSTHS